MFDSLSLKLQNVFKKLRGKGKLSLEDINNTLREVRIALLEADVNYQVVKRFINKIKEKTKNEEVIESLSPAQQVIKIVHQELIEILGQSEKEINFSKEPPTKIMLVGLQGSGKTTTAAKLAHYLKKKEFSPILVAADVRRPAAIKQLQILANQLNMPFYPNYQLKGNLSSTKIILEAVDFSKQNNYNVIIIDTQGRLHIDEELMMELKENKNKLNPEEIILVADAMTGQDAVNQAVVFHKELNLTGIILTKLDGDARGGAALSIKEVTGCPIKFIGIGEKINNFEVFHPERLSSRILGMGDVLSLIEKVETTFDLKKQEELEKKLRKDEWTLEDFKEQLQQIKKIGPIEQLLEMIPGFSKISKKEFREEENNLKKMEAIINSMTKKERENPDIIDGSRKRRIAKGSGTTVQEINMLLKQFDYVKKMIRQIGRIEKGFKMKNLLMQ